MMGLRLKEGIDVINDKGLAKQGFLKIENNKLRATKKGFLVLNSLITKLLET